MDSVEPIKDALLMVAGEHRPESVTCKRISLDKEAILTEIRNRDLQYIKGLGFSRAQACAQLP